MLGINAKLYVSTGSYASPDFDEGEIDLVADATLNDAWDEGNADARDTLVHQNEPTMLALDLSGRVRVDPDDAGYVLLRDAHVFKRLIDVLVLNGPIDQNGSEGYRYYGKVFQWNEGQNLADVIYKDFTIKPSPGDEPPMFVTVAGGVPVYHVIGEEGS